MSEDIARTCRYCDGRGSWQASKDPDEINYCTFCDGGMRQERWRAVVGFEGRYEVSDLGRVRNSRTDHVLSAATSRSGHQRVVLCRDGKGKDMYVHRLVLMAFVGPCPEGMEGCHNDGDATHNDVDNLRWDTRAENNRDAVRHGTHFNMNKTHCPRGHELRSPNLSAAQLKNGERQCLACARARTTFRRYGGSFQKLADDRYFQITGTRPEQKDRS